MSEYEPFAPAEIQPSSAEVDALYAAWLAWIRERAAKGSVRLAAIVAEHRRRWEKSDA